MRHTQILHKALEVMETARHVGGMRAGEFGSAMNWNGKTGKGSALAGGGYLSRMEKAGLVRSACNVDPRTKRWLPSHFEITPTGLSLLQILRLEANGRSNDERQH